LLDLVRQIVSPLVGACIKQYFRQVIAAPLRISHNFGSLLLSRKLLLEIFLI